MDEQRLRDELRARDRAMRPDPQFADQLFARLATELRLRPDAQSNVRRPAHSPRRWLPAIALALLTVASIGMLAFLARQDDDRLACTPELAAVAARRLGESAGYTYRLEGWLDLGFAYNVGGQPQPSRIEVVIDGEVAGDAVHERYLSGGQWAFGDPMSWERTDAAIQVDDRLWLRNYSWPDRPWMPFEHIYDRGAYGMPNLAQSTGDRLPRMAEGPAGAPPAAWTVVDDESSADAPLCTLRDERRWSDVSTATRTVTLRVDPQTGLPVHIAEEWHGFGSGEQSRDRRFEVTVAYPEVPPSIAPPAPDLVGENLSQAWWSEFEEFYEEPAQTIVAPGEVVINTQDGPWARVTVTEVVERREFEGVTATPGNVLLSFYSRHESLRDGTAWFPASDWQFYAHGPGSPWSTPIHALDTLEIRLPEPYLGNTQGTSRSIGEVVEGWLTLEVPADRAVSMWFGPSVASPARVILRQAGPAEVQESPAPSP